MGDLTRLRLYFDNGLLRSFNQSDGSNRCWFVIYDDLLDIDDLTKEIIERFNLEQICPHGIILSMDDFVLPVLGSLHLLRDKDIVSVKKRILPYGQNDLRIQDVAMANNMGSESVENLLMSGGVDPLLPIEGFGNKTGGVDKREASKRNAKRSIQISGSVGKKTGNGVVEPLAIEEFEKENGGYQSEHEEEEEEVNSPEHALYEESPSSGKTISKKRKSSKNLQSKKKKKIKTSSPQKHHVVPVEDVGDDVHTKRKEGSHHKGVLPKKKFHKKDRSSKKNGKLEKASATEVVRRVINITETVLSEDSDDQLQENGTKNVDVSHVSEGTVKLPSRSARRKKAKRKWLRELVNSQKKEQTQSHLPEKPVDKRSPEPRQTDQNNDMEIEVVPIVVRPGHIRFEPLDEDDAVQQRQDPVKSFQWNGTTSKKKGQKWGMEKTSVSRSNDYKNSREDFMERLVVEEPKIVHGPIDFEKLKPFSILPKVGNVLAYRLVELSSSWCPELSPFRVGKILRYDSMSNTVVLAPVPEYPNFDENADETDTPEQAASLYGEDGSLEIDFASLVDVRIFDLESSGPATVITGGCNKAPVSTQTVSSVRINGDNACKNARKLGGTPHSGGHVEAPVSTQINNVNEGKNAGKLANGGSIDIWEQLSQAVSEKKTQLSQKNGWNGKEGSTSAWSYKALRSSALGPTMAWLRSGKNL